MILKAHTESGSIYVLDRIQMTWDRERLVPDQETALPVRTPGGTLATWPEVEVGRPIVLIGPPLVEGADGRMIATSRVIEIEEIHERTDA